MANGSSGRQRPEDRKPRDDPPDLPEEFLQYRTYPGVRSPNRKPRGTRPDSGTQEPAGPRWQGQGGGGAARDNPVRTKVKAATAGAIPGGLLGQYVLSLLEGRYGALPPELDALVVALVAAAGAFTAGYYKRDQFSPPS